MSVVQQKAMVVKGFVVVVICWGMAVLAEDSNGTTRFAVDGTSATARNGRTVVEEFSTGASNVERISTTIGEVSTESEEVETFEQFEKRVKTNVGNAVKKLLLPYLMKGSEQATISGGCTASILKLIGGVRQLREWAIRFLDATGKIPSGILEGTSFSMGSYDECLDIEVGRRDERPRTPEEVTMRGQYCLLEVHRPEPINRAIEGYEEGEKDAPIAKTRTFLNMFVRYKHLSNSTMKVGVCVPSKCTQEDVENILSSETIRSALGKVTVPYCRQKGDRQIMTSEIILMCLFGCAAAITVLGTIGDVFLRYHLDEKKSEPITYMRLLIKKTSIYSNALRVISPVDRSSDSLLSLRGLRPMIVMIIMYSHSYAHLHYLHFQTYTSAANFLKFFESFTFNGIGNGSVTLDSLVVVVAISLTYNVWRYIPEKGTVQLKVSKLLVQRCFRLAAAQLLGICLFLLFPVFGSGPFWNAYLDPQLDNCRQRWWLNVLFIHNIWDQQELCLYHTWIIALITQLTVLGVLVMWILKKSRAFGIFFILLIILSGMIGVAVMVVVHDLPGALAFYMIDKRTFPIAWNDVFTLPYDHMGPFAIGLSAGYFLAVKKDKWKMSKVSSAFLWCLSVCSCVGVMFGLYGYRNGEKMTTPLAVFYAAMNRNAWCLGIAWLVVACTTRHGGAVSRVLKSTHFVIPDRLCCVAYIIHIPIMYYHRGCMRERFFMGHLDVLFLAVSYIATSFIASFLLHAIFVEPYFAIESHVSSLFRSKDKLSFKPKTETKSSPGLCVTEVPTPIPNSCVHTGCYSKKQEGV